MFGIPACCAGRPAARRLWGRDPDGSPSSDCLKKPTFVILSGARSAQSKDLPRSSGGGDHSLRSDDGLELVFKQSSPASALSASSRSNSSRSIPRISAAMSSTLSFNATSFWCATRLIPMIRCAERVANSEEAGRMGYLASDAKCPTFEVRCKIGHLALDAKCHRCITNCVTNRLRVTPGQKFAVF